MGLKSVGFVLRSDNICKDIDLIFNIKRFLNVSRLDIFIVKGCHGSKNGFNRKKDLWTWFYLIIMALKCDLVSIKKLILY